MCKKIGAEALAAAKKKDDIGDRDPVQIDASKCLGCGACTTVCPTDYLTLDMIANIGAMIPNEFNENLEGGKPIHIPYPQAVPNVPAIDPNYCVHFITGDCQICADKCQADAITHDLTDEEVEIEAGSIILAPGFETFDPQRKPELGYRYPNVITSLEFERLLSASGPTEGHVARPSDEAEPKKVAWLQCVGSRDPSIGQDYCSYVCCMYATKQAIIAGEHIEGLAPTIFFIDVRAQGKGFDAYYERAKNERGVRYVRSHISRVTDNPATGDLRLHYFDEAGEAQDETFDLVVLSVGMCARDEARDLADKLGLGLDNFGFALPTSPNPLITKREGVYVCGAFAGPKDIPETVTQASGAAGQAAELLAEVRGSEIEPPTYPEEEDVTGQEPRVGVFICHCGINIAGVVDVDEVTEYVKGLPHVVHADHVLFSCSTDALDKIIEAIKEHGLNRVIVSSCSPRTHEPLFRETLKRAGLNPYLFEMANIRDQCSWVHQSEKAAATQKAKDLTRMALARSVMLEPIHEFPVKVDQKGLVIGGGAAGLSAALSLARQGFSTTVVEKTDRLGGLARKIIRTVDGFNLKPYLKTLIAQVEDEDRITVLTGCEVERISGTVGRFAVTTRQGGRKEELTCGAIILATGGAEHEPGGAYLFGQDERVMTQLGLLEKIASGDELPSEVVMIQCVGSREEEHLYCSRVCCSQACQNALMLKEKNRQTEVSILYRDIRTYATKEKIYRAAREAGVRFIRYEPEAAPQVSADGARLKVEVFDQALRQKVILRPEAVVLSAAIRPNPEAKELASRLKLPLDADGFFMEAHLKLRPVDFAAQGFFLAGLAHGPKFLDESISQAKAAAARAGAVLAAEERMAGGEISVVDPDKCVACLTCARICPYDVPVLGPEGVVVIDPMACQGCGSCASACPRKAIEVQHHTDAQIVAKEAALLGR